MLHAWCWQRRACVIGLHVHAALPTYTSERQAAGVIELVRVLLSVTASCVVLQLSVMGRVVLTCCSLCSYVPSAGACQGYWGRWFCL
jgi:hypothetical protein